MVTTIALDDELATRFRCAVRAVYPDSYGQIKKEVRKAFENHIKVLEAKKK